MSPAPPPPPACSIKGGRGRASSHLSLLLLLPLLSATVSAKDVFTNHFLVHLDPEHGHPDPPALARDIAKRNGFHSLGPLLNSPHEFHFVHAGLPHARHKRSVPHSRKLKTDPQVHRVYQQTGFRRVKRGYREEPDYMALGPKSVQKKSSWSELRASLDGEINPAVVHPEEHFQQLQEGAAKDKRGYNSLTVDNLVGPPPPPKEPSDPLFPYQWYLKNTGQNGGKARLDLNVEAAWAQGITGRNVTTAIMDDGVDYMHPDIINNYNTVSRIPMDKSLFMTIDTNACSGLETEVNYLEHVQAVVTLNSTRRGAVQLFLRSPMGTRSMILSERPNDADSQDGFTKWPFMTTHTWAEYPRGRWSLEIEFVKGAPQEGFVKEWTLLLHGTKEAPYTSLPVTDPHSKLAVVKKAHEDRKKM